MLNNIKIAIGADHRGYQLKEYLKNNFMLAETSIEWVDVGAYTQERSDYPEFSINVAKLVQEKKVTVGILICGTGVGMVIAANRFSGVYAGLAWNQEIARLAKEDDHTNILVLPADFISLEEGANMLYSWLTAECKQGRYAQRMQMIDAIRGC